MVISSCDHLTQTTIKANSTFAYIQRSGSYKQRKSKLVKVLHFIGNLSFLEVQVDFFKTG